MNNNDVLFLFSIERYAQLSDCKQYRYLLRRVWDHTKLRTLIVMLNPSTADGEIDDATIRSCTRLCRSLGYGSFEVVNLFALRATDPAELQRASDPIGPNNDEVIKATIARCDLIICAWGAHPMASNRDKQVCNLLRAHRSAIFCLGTTKSGAPKHPLYIKTGTELQVFKA